MNNNQKLIIGLGLVILVLALSAYYYLVVSRQNQELNTGNEQKKSVLLSEIPDNWKTFSDSALGISFRYPNDWNDVVLKKENNDLSVFPGTLISGEGGSDIYFTSYSKDYKSYDFPSFNENIDINWSVDEFNKNIKYPEALLFKKLNSKSALLFNYIAPECSPMVSLIAVVPLNDEYPNLLISIKGDFESNPIIESYKQSQEFEQSDGCDLTKPYKEIANKIASNTYSDELSKNINIVSLIASSIVSTK